MRFAGIRQLEFVNRHGESRPFRVIGERADQLEYHLADMTGLPCPTLFFRKGRVYEVTNDGQPDKDTYRRLEAADSRARTLQTAIDFSPLFQILSPNSLWVRLAKRLQAWATHLQIRPITPVRPSPTLTQFQDDLLAHYKQLPIPKPVWQIQVLEADEQGRIFYLDTQYDDATRKTSLARQMREAYHYQHYTAPWAKQFLERMPALVQLEC